MDPELVKTYPRFGNLVSRINEKLSDEKASPSVQLAYDQARRNLTKARSEYLRNKILYYELHELLTDLEVGGRENTITIDEGKLRDVLSKTLAFAEIPDYLHFCPSATSTSTLFGVTEDDVDRHNPVKMHLPDLLQVVIPRLENKLAKKCEELYAYFDPTNSQVPTSGALLTAKAHSLPTHVEERQNVLAREQRHFREIRQRRDNQFWSYFQKLLECLSIMETLIKNFKCGSQAETDVITVQQLSAKCKVICLKLRSEKLRIECDTYTVETVKALKSVSGHLETATSQANRELSATSQSLHAFRRLGPEFTALATQMAQLQHELQNKKWGLGQFDPRRRDSDAGRREAVSGATGLAEGGSNCDGDREPMTKKPGTTEHFLLESGKPGSRLETATGTSPVRELRVAPPLLGVGATSASRDSFQQPPAVDSQSDLTGVTRSSGSRDSPSASLSEALKGLSVGGEGHGSQSPQAKSQQGKRVTFQQGFDQ